MFKLFYKKTEKLSAVQQSESAYAFLKEKLSDYLKINSEEIEIRKDNKGCPHIVDIENIYISISHTEGLIACAFSDSRVGVDVEKVKPRRKSVEKRVFTENETVLLNNAENEDKAFFTLWTLKESYLKAIGTGFADNAKTVEFISIENPIKADKKDFGFFTECFDGYVISVCENKI